MVKPLTYGRLGNFLFQAAGAISYALDHQLEFTMPTLAESRDPKWSPVYLQHLVNPNFNPNLPSVTIEEPVFCHHERPFKEEWREQNILLNGYWQSEKYFKKWEWNIRNLFDFPWFPHSGTAVHVRRGDYLRWTRKHPPVPVQWIERAMATFPGENFRFFSDDISWCKETFGHRDDCTFSEGNNELEDLVEMSWCWNQICSASTFSWWAAWLNQNPMKRVVMPTPWFVPGWNGLDVKDIVPVEWERLK